MVFRIVQIHLTQWYSCKRHRSTDGCAELKNSIFIGLSIGGMIAQGLALKRLDLVRAMVLSNTAARIGNRQIWEHRISKVRSSGMKALTEETMKRWFSNRFLKSKDLNIWKNMFERQPLEGYIGCSNAISGTDFYIRHRAYVYQQLE